MDAHKYIIKALEHEEPDRAPALAQVFDYPFKNFKFITCEKTPNLFMKF